MKGEDEEADGGGADAPGGGGGGGVEGAGPDGTATSPPSCEPWRRGHEAAAAAGSGRPAAA